MRNSTDVITQVVNGKGPQLAQVLEVSVSRVYEILSTDNPYPKAKRLIRAIAQVNLGGVALIKADIDAMFADILNESDGAACPHELHKESYEATAAVFEDKPKAVKRKELLDVMAAAGKHIRDLDKPTNGHRELLPADIREKAKARKVNG